MMMEFKGTGESWVVVNGSDSIWIESELWHIAEVSKKSTLEEEQANAKLIASAPDLLKALQLMVNNFTEPTNGAQNQAILKSKKAIEKALK